MILEICLIILVIICVLVSNDIFSKKSASPYAKLADIPCPDSLPFFGNISDCLSDELTIWKTFRKRALKYYPIYRTKLLNFDVVSVLDPEDIEMILRDGRSTTKGIFYGTLRKWVGNGLAVSEGTIWQKRRKWLTKSFHFSVFRNYLEIFQREADTLIDRLLKTNTTIASVDNIIKNSLVKIIHDSIVGGEGQISDEKAEEYMNAVNTSTRIIGHKCLKPWYILAYKYLPSFKKTEDDAMNIIHDFSSRIYENYQESGVDEGKMLSLMFNASELFNEKSIKDEIDAFMFGGHDTTKSLLIFAMVTLANYPEYQEQIYKEMLEVTGNDDDFSHATILNMTFLDRFTKECLRFFPTVPFIARELRKEMITKSGYVLPAGTNVMIHIFDIHHSPISYPEPEKFDPDRFLPENLSTRHPYSFIPFGAGPRVCIAYKFAMLEIKTFICRILRRFKLKPVDLLEDLVFTVDLVLKTTNDLRVEFIERID